MKVILIESPKVITVHTSNKCQMENLKCEYEKKMSAATSFPHNPTHLLQAGAHNAGNPRLSGERVRRGAGRRTPALPVPEGP